MGRLHLIIPDSVILKLQYEIANFQPGDVAYDIALEILEGDVSDDITFGYLLSELETFNNSFGDKKLLEEFESFVLGVKK